MKARVIAFYLPQFYPIKENDDTWGKGFTEWNNVVKAKPLFKGHYQPRIPADLGFYDLRLGEVRIAQAEMARKSGVEGFMYWHYWFGNGKQLLERPFFEVLTSGQPDFPFCLGWANHSWTTKTWVKVGAISKNSTIVEQTYPGIQDYINHFHYVLPAFKDQRYITVDSKPLFYIYAPEASPEIKIFIETWQKLALKNGLPGIHFVARMQGRTANYDNLKNLGFQAMNRYGAWHAQVAQLGKWKRIFKTVLKRETGIGSLLKYDFKTISQNLFDEEDSLEDVYPTIIPQFDRTARAGNQAIIYHNSSPKLFGEQIELVLEKIKEKEEQHKIVFLSSWNEWGEGSYIEPDVKYGWGYLDELKNKIL